MPGNIFISYRRNESPKDARALYERLRREFGEQRVFIDLEGIDPGEDFVDSIERQLQGCEVLVALIGRGWIEARNARGERRLDDESDFVRIELRTALQRGIRVIPVLVDGCVLPDAQQLPDDLRPLLRRQAVSLDFDKFDTDVGRLVAAIRRVLEAQPSPARWPAGRSKPRAMADGARSPVLGSRIWLAAAAGVAALAALGWLVASPRRVELREPPRPSVASPIEPQAAAASAAAQLASSAPVRPPRATPAKRFRDCDDPACPWLVTLDKGGFTMGSPATEVGREDDEGPPHSVHIGYRLAVMETEVTRGQLRAFVDATRRPMEEGCSAHKDGKWDKQADRNWLATGFEQTDEHPAVCVSWNDGQAYALWLSKKTGQHYRLLSEAEWEFAARAGTASRFSFGDADSAVCAYANVADLAAKAKFAHWNATDCDDGAAYTAPVRRYRPNPWGLYDMHGNVWEWVQDCKRLADYAAAPADGSSVKDANCERRLWRGGAWVSGPSAVRSANRGAGVPTFRGTITGLRLARTLP